MTADLPPRIGDLLGEVGRTAGVNDPIQTGALWNRWEMIVGADIAAHADPSSLRDGVLRVRADSPAWATEIGYLAEEILRRINVEMNRELVREVRVWTGPRRKNAVSRAMPKPEAGNAETRARAPAGTDDPAIAFDRARSAWKRRANGRAGPRENERKSW
ncbi:MAG: DUF721 domain-containing protein [Actinomycetota bacterium]